MYHRGATTDFLVMLPISRQMSSALILFEMLFSQPVLDRHLVLNDHLPIPRPYIHTYIHNLFGKAGFKLQDWQDKSPDVDLHYLSNNNE